VAADGPVRGADLHEPLDLLEGADGPLREARDAVRAVGLLAHVQLARLAEQVPDAWRVGDARPARAPRRGALSL